MQMEYLKSKISPDFVKLCNPEWNENVTEEDLAQIRKCIEATGIMEVIPERLMDGIIPVTGS